MIVGIGTDLIEIPRVNKAYENVRFQKRIFTEAERLLICDDRKKAAGNFAAKEAVAKMFGTGFSKCLPNQIEVLRDDAGKPYVNLYGGALELAKALNVTKIHVSITNTREFASAVAVGENGGSYEICSECKRDETNR